MAEQDGGNLKEIEAQRVQILGALQTIDNLQIRIDHKTDGKVMLANKLIELEAQTKKAKIDYEDVIELLKDEVWTLTQKKLNIENELSIKTTDLALTQAALKTKIEHMLSDFDNERTSMNEKYKSLEEKYYLIADFEEEKEDMLKTIEKLEEDLEAEKKDKLRCMADKEREKVEKIERLKEEMALKIQETRTSLLAFKTEQLDTASKLAVVQNHQLTTELEYQGRQVEKMIAKYTKIEDENNELKREVQIHKEVENEMAKKTSRAQGVIKKLNDRVKELEDHIKELEKPPVEFSNTGLRKLIEEKGVTDKKKDDVIRTLERNLEAAEAKLAKLQNDYGILARDFEGIENRLTKEKNRYSDAATLVREALENLVDKDSSMSQKLGDSASHLALDLDEIRETGIKNLDKGQKQMLLDTILEQIKSHLNEKNLVNAFYPVLKGRAQSYGVLVMDKKAYHLPNIHEKSLTHKINKSKYDYTSPKSIKSSANRSSIRDWEISLSTSNGSPVSSLREKIKYKM